ncbi:response regulator [Mesorhizobium sp.]|uniref:response regulator n=1 Tax=Mesorhizobium sp. TaxID=1871066 RepID=UPI0025DAB4C1|nr:response regulator [Mesorhizobium sp.]
MPQLDESDTPTILVVEDEYFIASEIRLALENLGARVLGPVSGLEQALQVLDQSRPDSAILDINLRGEMAFPLAAELKARGIPFLFATGYDGPAIPESFGDVQRWEKPFDARRLAAASLAISKA